MYKLSIALLLFVMLISSVSLFGGNIFEDADSFNKVLDRAKTNRRLLLTYAASATKPPCIAMENATFQNTEVQSLLKSSYYPVKIDLSSELGKQWAASFRIVTTPTLLFFDNRGTLIKQVENGVSSGELKSILEDVVFFNVNGYWPMETAPVILTATVPDQSIISMTQPLGTLPCPLLKHQLSNQSFKILIDKVPTNDTLINHVIEKAKLEYPEHPICIKLVKEGQKSYFQVLIGAFSQNEKAEALLVELKASGFEDAEVFNLEEETP